MSKKCRPLLAVLGLLIFFSLCNHVYAQEIQSQCKDGCTNQTSDLTSNDGLAYQTFSLSSDQIKKALGSDESDKNCRYSIYAILKSGQVKWKYSETDITNLSLSLIFHEERSNKPKEILPTFQEKKEKYLTAKWIYHGEPINMSFTIVRDAGLPTQYTLSYSKQNQTDLDLLIEGFKYYPEKKHHRDTDRQLPMAYIA